MNFLVDESTGMAVVEFLRATGHDALSVSEVMPHADDPSILLKAEREKRIVITNDKDFGELVFRSHQANQGVILLRLQNDHSASRVRAIKILLQEYAGRLENHFSMITETEVRIRPIPK